MHDISRSSLPAAEAVDGFGFIRRKKEEGKIREIGFSFHDNADVLDEILDKYPYVDFVQLMLNYLDWEHASVQCRKCYETALKHGKNNDKRYEGLLCILYR